MALRVAAIGLCFGLGLMEGQMVKGPTGPTTVAAAGDVKTMPGAAGHALEAGDVEAFFDGVVPLQLERSDIAGASVLVMRGDATLLEKGYGFADAKKKQAVDPARTIFRLASISKLFTWVSVMQLEEQGKLDIDADVNKYLDFAIRPKFGKAITLRNLMTHSGGFEEEDRDVIMLDAKKVPSLRAFLIRNQPERMFAPGTETAYSNYGVGLAGYIVQRVSGEPYEQYVAEHIFGPLGMTGSTFYQPPRAGLVSMPSEGYRASTEKPSVGFEIFNPAPAGGLSSTAADMGRFARALLHGGTLEGRQILRPETLQRMWTPQFRASEKMPPICMGFYEDWRNGVHWIGHEGDLIAFHSMFFMDPVSQTTIFVAYNSANGGSKPRPELLDMFTDRYFPDMAGVGKPVFIPETRAELKEIEGTYVSTRRADSNRTSLSKPFDEAVASVDKEGALHMGESKDLRGHGLKFKPIGRDLWQEIDGQRRLFAIRGEDGRIARLATNFAGAQMERVKWYEKSVLVLPLAGASLLALLAVIVAPVFRLGKRIFLWRRRRAAPELGTAWLPVGTKVAAVMWVVPLAAAALVMVAAGDVLPPTDAWDKWFALMNVVVGLALLLSLFAVGSAIRVWRRGELRWITKVKFTVVALSCVAMAYVSLHYHLIGTLRL